MAQDDHGKQESSRRARLAQDNFRVVAEGADWIVVDKPAGLLTHPTKPDGAATLWDGLRALLAYELAGGGQLSIITRLDRETSGLVLVALTAARARAFGQAMQAGAIRKEYLAIVRGWPEWEEKTIEAPIIRQGEVGPSAIWLQRCIHPRGAAAVTDVLVKHRWETPEGRFAVVRARPRTGRTHQIRVHLAAAGHPLVGDKIYGGRPEAYTDFIAHGWTSALAAELLLPRHALHASRLGFATPAGAREAVAAWPDDLRLFVTAAGLPAGGF